MALMVDVSRETERRLEREALRRGVDVNELARRLIEQDSLLFEELGPSLWETSTPQEWIRQTREWIASHADWPVLPDEAYERESFYEGRP